MQAYVAVLNYAIPFFVVLLLTEVFVAWRKKAKVIRSVDTLASLSSGLTNVIKDVLGLTVVIISYAWVEKQVGLFDIEATWWVYLIAFIGIDFAGYWSHRLSHQVNYFWNHHIIHHSSEEFNLGCALRQTISAWFSMSFIFLFPVAVLGVPPAVIAVIQPLHLFAQYWYHTRLIGKMGVLEHIIVTPSHHRVHHAINEVYLDKNLSQIFIFWDKLFGTFQEELDEEPPVYGVKRPLRTWNPIIINFSHLWLLIKDAWRTDSWSAKFKIWFMPTGWRPTDVAEKYPEEVIADVHAYQKYDSNPSLGLLWWSWLQWLITFGAMMVMFNSIPAIGMPNAILIGAFLVYTIFSFTMLMDKHAWSVPVESLRMAFALAIVYFQAESLRISPSVGYVILGYCLLSLALTYYFSHSEKRSPELTQATA